MCLRLVIVMALAVLKVIGLRLARHCKARYPVLSVILPKLNNFHDLLTSMDDVGSPKRWMDGLLAILCPFQQYFSHIRATSG